MKFKRIKNRRVKVKSIEDVRFAIYKHKEEIACVIKMSEDLTDRICLDNGSRVAVYYSEEDPNIILLKKSSDNAGYKISHKSSAKTYLGFRFNIPDELKANFKNITGTREVEYDFFDEGLRIYCS